MLQERLFLRVAIQEDILFTIFPDARILIKGSCNKRQEHTWFEQYIVSYMHKNNQVDEN